MGSQVYRCATSCGGSVLSKTSNVSSIALSVESSESRRTGFFETGVSEEATMATRAKSLAQSIEVRIRELQHELAHVNELFRYTTILWVYGGKLNKEHEVLLEQYKKRTEELEAKIASIQAEHRDLLILALRLAV